MLFIASFSFASTTLEQRLDNLTSHLVGQTVPSSYASVIDDGMYVIKFVNLPTIPDHIINFLDDLEYKSDLRYTIEIKDKQIVKVTKGGQLGYNALIGVTNGAALRILDSNDSQQQLKTEISDSQVRYRAYGYLDSKLQFIKFVSGFFSLFSKDMGDIFSFLKGLQ